MVTKQFSRKGIHDVGEYHDFIRRVVINALAFWNQSSQHPIMTFHRPFFTGCIGMREVYANTFFFQPREIGKLRSVVGSNCFEDFKILVTKGCKLRILRIDQCYPQHFPSQFQSQMRVWLISSDLHLTLSTTPWSWYKVLYFEVEIVFVSNAQKAPTCLGDPIPTAKTEQGRFNFVLALSVLFCIFVDTENLFPRWIWMAAIPASHSVLMDMLHK